LNKIIIDGMHTIVHHFNQKPKTVLNHSHALFQIGHGL
jgi:hypothetical protein